MTKNPKDFATLAIVDFFEKGLTAFHLMALQATFYIIPDEKLILFIVFCIAALTKQSSVLQKI